MGTTFSLITKHKRLIKQIGKFDILSAHKSMVTGAFTHINVGLKKCINILIKKLIVK